METWSNIRKIFRITCLPYLQVSSLSQGFGHGNGHTILNGPDRIWSRTLSRAGPGLVLGWETGNWILGSGTDWNGKPRSQSARRHTHSLRIHRHMHYLHRCEDVLFVCRRVHHMFTRGMCMPCTFMMYTHVFRCACILHLQALLHTWMLQVTCVHSVAVHIYICIYRFL